MQNFIRSAYPSRSNQKTYDITFHQAAEVIEFERSAAEVLPVPTNCKANDVFVSETFILKSSPLRKNLQI